MVLDTPLQDTVAVVGPVRFAATPETWSGAATAVAVVEDVLSPAEFTDAT